MPEPYSSVSSGARVKTLHGPVWILPGIFGCVCTPRSSALPRKGVQTAAVRHAQDGEVFCFSSSSRKSTGAICDEKVLLNVPKLEMIILRHLAPDLDLDLLPSFR